MGDAVMATKQTVVVSEFPSSAHPVGHWRNLFWWIALAVTVTAILQGVEYMSSASSSPPPAPIMAGQEREAFVALVFGKISSSRDSAIPTESFRADMTALKKAGYSTVRLAQVRRWQLGDEAALPEKPLLLTFDEAYRETLETADEVFASVGMTGVVFVNPSLLDQANIHMVSWHRLKQLVKSGRWEVGVSGCQDSGVGGFTSTEVLAKRYARERKVLEQRLGQPIIAADCSRAWNADQGGEADIWPQTLKAASLSVGFVTGLWGANYRDDPWSGLRRIRVSKEWSEADLLARLEAHAPRRKPFIDHFQAARSAPDWVVDRGEIAIEDGALRVASKEGEQGALVMLGGTEHWQNAGVEVQLEGQPQGQFWISLRQRQGEPFVRLGVSEGLALLQARNKDGSFNQLASREVLSGTITLALRVVDSRVVASVNGRPLLKRPAEMPAGSDYGPLTLAVWNESDEDPAGAGSASVRLNWVKAEPLPQKYGIVAAIPGAAAWTKLRREVDDLYMLSPKYFTWASGGTHKEVENRDLAVEIFARHHRLKFLPALILEDNIRSSETVALAEQALNWAADPAFDGLNIIMKRSTAGDRQSKDFLANLDARMAAKGKILAVTMVGDIGQDVFSLSRDDLVLVKDGGNIVSEDEYTVASVP
jgi:peptidoglycan/xylan/chitin deacetylase (PgdA/CDA1 family)